MRINTRAEFQTIFWLLWGAFIAGLASAILHPLGWLVSLVLVGVGYVLTRQQPRMPELPFWVLAGLLTVGMNFYLILRTPTPTPRDVSVFAPQKQALLEAEVTDDPKLGSNGALSVVVRVTKLIAPVEALTEGNLYVRYKGPELNPELKTDPSKAATTPLVQSIPLPKELLTQIYPGVQLQLIGSLTANKAATNPGQFDFGAFLARKSVFATFYADQVKVLTQPDNWLTQIRRTLVASHVAALGEPTGQLLASMVVGSGAANLDPKLNEAFTRVGLSHILVASGMQVSLIVGNCLILLRRQSTYLQAGVAGTVLMVYLLLVGGGPSIIRAGVMGYFALAGLVYGKKGESVPVLALSAMLLLLWNPLWITDVGFHFSFLATLGLLITVPLITQKLTFLPALIATNIAVPIAAYIWTLPVQLQVFGKLSPYALPANFFSVVIVEVVTVGGFISSVISLFFAPLAQLIDLPLGWALQILIAMVNFFVSLPGSTLYPGALSGIQVVLLYVVLVLLHFPTPLSKQPLLGTGTAGLLLIGPALLPLSPAVQLTVLDTGRATTALLEAEGKTYLIGDGEERAMKFTVVPYLQQQGTTKIDGLVALKTPDLKGIDQACTYGTLGNVWSVETIKLPCGTPLIYSAPNILRLGNQTFVRVLSLEPLALVIQTKEGRVLYLGSSSVQEQRQVRGRFQKELAEVDWIWTDGKFLIDSWLDVPKLKGIMASNRFLNERTVEAIKSKEQLRFIWIKEKGAMTWTGADRVTTVL